VRQKVEDVMKKTVVSVWLFLACAVAWALPSVQQVQAEVQQGHYVQAESMMREVVDAKPGSAKGHYIYAEILAHNGSFAKAAEEAGKARQLDPELKFTQPEKFRAFESLLDREQKPAQRTQSSDLSFPAAAAPVAPAPSRSAGVPAWMWGAGLALVAYLLWRGFSRSRASQAPRVAPGFAGAGGAPTNAFGTPGMGGAGVPMSGMAPASSPSSGLLGTGLAVAGGVAAGMLVDEMLHRHQGAGTDQLSGLQRGVLDSPPIDNAANELENRSVDFGNGADWDSGGGADLGGGGSDGGGWD
jgi:hypothetical protein